LVVAEDGVATEAVVHQTCALIGDSSVSVREVEFTGGQWDGVIRIEPATPADEHTKQCCWEADSDLGMLIDALDKCSRLPSERLQDGNWKGLRLLEVDTGSSGTAPSAVEYWGFDEAGFLRRFETLLRQAGSEVTAHCWTFNDVSHHHRVPLSMCLVYHAPDGSPGHIMNVKLTAVSQCRSLEDLWRHVPARRGYSYKDTRTSPVVIASLQRDGLPDAKALRELSVGGALVERDNRRFERAVGIHLPPPPQKPQLMPWYLRPSVRYALVGSACAALLVLALIRWRRSG
jgi:hypothetical protein